MSSAKRPRYALLSVTDKVGIVEFARGLQQLGFTILSTGGTAQALRAADVDLVEVADLTQSPELFDGRVKTLHPRIHGGILYDRDRPAHVQQAATHGIAAIDLVAVNLYKFAEHAAHGKLPAGDAIEHIDIGGPAMLRAAAKNFRHVIVVVDPSDYSRILQALRSEGVNFETRQQLAAKVYAATAQYDRLISTTLGEPALGDSELHLRRVQELRYGENPHQKAVWWRHAGTTPHGLSAVTVLQGKELSYNNLLDLDAASALVREFTDPAVVIVKHNNPCGVACLGSNAPVLDTYAAALAVDPKSAFGGIVAFNRRLDARTADAMSALFLECIIAPDVDADARQIFARKSNLRVLVAPWLSAPESSSEQAWQWRSVAGGVLAQTADQREDYSRWQVVTRASPTPAQQRDLEVAVTVAKHVKSNAIVLVRNGVAVGIGAGQMSRIDAAELAVKKAADVGSSIVGAAMASDAFFPFRDTVDFAAKHQIAAIAQPGGSVRDQESIAACDEQDIAMVVTGQRHFRH